MCRPVGADEARAVDREADRQTLDRDVVHDLIVGALQERGVDGAERLQAFGGEAGRKRHRVLLGDADVECAIGEFLAEEIEAGAVRHGRRDGDDALVLLRFRDQAIGEHARVGRRVLLRLHLRAGDDVELCDAVILVVGGFGRRVALALLGDDVDQDRALCRVLHVLQNRQELVEIVAVDGTHVIEAQLLEPHAALPEVARVFLHARGAPLPALRQALGELLCEVAELKIGIARRDARKIGREGASGRRDRHVVVVEDHDQALVAGARIVHGLIRHARAHRAVADHADDVVRLALEIARDRHAETGGDRRRRVGRAEGVVLALGPLGEARQPAALAQRADAVAAAGQDLVRIGLVTDVPDQAVARRVEDPVQRDRQLHDAEPGAEMAARHGDRLDGLVAQLVGDLAEIGLRVRAEIRRRADTVEERGLAHGGVFILRSWRPGSLMRGQSHAAGRKPSPGGRRGTLAPNRRQMKGRYRAIPAARCGRTRPEQPYSGSSGSVPRGVPSAPTVSFSTRASACFRSRSQCSRSASPRS